MFENVSDNHAMSMWLALYVSIHAFKPFSGPQTGGGVLVLTGDSKHRTLQVSGSLALADWQSDLAATSLVS